MITVDGLKVGYLYRKEPHDETGQRMDLHERAESQEYMDDPENLGIYDVNTIANHDPEIIPFLDAPLVRPWRGMPIRASSNRSLDLKTKNRPAPRC